MNAVYLMLSNFVMAGFGFLFWIIVTRGYAAHEVGLATTLLSVSSLLSLIALVGFDTTFVRFLPAAEQKSKYISSGFIIVTIVSIVLSAGVGILLPWLSPNLSLLHTVGGLVSFVFFTTATTLNVLTNAVFLAYKQARYILIINTLFSVVKVALPLLVFGNALTIFILAGIAQVIGLLLSLSWMWRRFDYRFHFTIDRSALKLTRKFSVSVYSASLLNLLPPTLLPLIVIGFMGAAQAAYYYMAFTIASVLYTVAYSSMQSVFAEGSHDETALKMHVIKAAKLITVVLLPGAVLTAILSYLLLMIFGAEYANQAAPLLQLFALSALPVAIYSALGAIFKVTKHLSGVVSMNIVYAVVILVCSYWSVPQFGLIAVGWSWMLGNGAACVVGVGLLWQRAYHMQHITNQKKGAHGTITRAR